MVSKNLSYFTRRPSELDMVNEIAVTYPEHELAIIMSRRRQPIGSANFAAPTTKAAFLAAMQLMASVDFVAALVKDAILIWSLWARCSHSPKFGDCLLCSAKQSFMAANSNFGSQ